MTLTVEIPAGLESELTAETEKMGLPLPEYALFVLSTGRVLTNPPKTGAELVEYWKSAGVIGSRPEITDSQAHARELREQAEKRSQHVLA